MEYILLAVVILSIAYGLGRHFFQPLQKFGSSVFTSTIACALEYGQLPAEITAEEGCSASIQATAMNGGSPSGKGGKSGPGGKGGSSDSGKDGNSSKSGSGKGSGSDSDSDSSNSEGSSSSSSENSESGKSGSGGSGSGSGSTTVISRNGTLQLGNAPGAEGSRSSNNEIVYDSSQFEGGEIDYSPGGSRAKRRKPIYRQIKGDMEDDLTLRKKKTKVVEKGGGRSVADSGGEEEGKPKRMVVSNKKDSKASETEEAAWDASKMIRMALIILMIVAILIFVFFQVSQIRKGSGSS